LSTYRSPWLRKPQIFSLLVIVLLICVGKFLVNYFYDRFMYPVEPWVLASLSWVVVLLLINSSVILFGIVREKLGEERVAVIRLSFVTSVCVFIIYLSLLFAFNYLILILESKFRVSPSHEVRYVFTENLSSIVPMVTLGFLEDLMRKRRVVKRKKKKKRK